VPTFAALPIRTPRLILRPLQREDADALFRIFSDAEVMRYWATPPWTSMEQAVDRIRQDNEYLAEGSALRLALEPNGGDGIVGAISLFAFVEQSQRAELGYILARPAWGQGLMHEALTALVSYAFQDLGLRRLEADIDPRNDRSARSLERLGFLREGLLRERWVVADEISDTALYGLLAREWSARHGARTK
jgi:RimJ/RimL family protein N-acetyltransferase